MNLEGILMYTLKYRGAIKTIPNTYQNFQNIYFKTSNIIFSAPYNYSSNTITTTVCNYNPCKKTGCAKYFTLSFYFYLNETLTYTDLSE